MAKKKYCIYLEEELKIILDSIGQVECRNLSQTIEYACKMYADKVVSGEVFKVDMDKYKKEEKSVVNVGSSVINEELKKQVPFNCDSEVLDIEF